MPMIKKSITVTDKQEAWIQAQLASGDYASDSEVIREALREKQDRVAEVQWIREQLIKGEESGFTTMTKEEIKAEAFKRMKANGRLSA